MQGLNYHTFKGINTGFSDKEGNLIYEGMQIRHVLNTDNLGTVKYGLYYNVFDTSEIEKFGGHVGFYVDWEDEYTRKDLYYWAKNSTIVKDAG